MTIREKVQMDIQGLIDNGPITIVAFGDSVTHGAFGAGEIDYDAVYWNQFRKRINDYRNYVPVNVINAGIGGIDACRPLENYLDSLKIIFERCSAKTEVVFMTPNMLNTHVIEEDTEERYRAYAAKTAEMQTNGRMDNYMESAVALAESMGVKVCNCYAKWKEMSKTQDITLLLDNRINHPTREMHKLFADMLFETVFGELMGDTEDESTMYKE